MSSLRLVTNSNPDWQEAGLCRQVDPEIFYPNKGESNLTAKSICSRCEVRTECLEYALGRNEEFGVWGGKSERERRKLKRRDGSEQVAA